MALLVALALVGFPPDATASEAPPEKLKLQHVVPAETLVFLQCAGMEQFKNDSKSLDLVRLWLDPEVRAFLADSEKMLSEQFKHQGKVNFPVREVWNLLKGDMALACTTRFTIFEEGAAPSMALGVNMDGNKEAFFGTLNHFLDMATEEIGLKQGHMDYRGQKIRYIGLPHKRMTVCYTTLDDLFVATFNRYFMQEILDCHLDQKAVLADEPAFDRCRSRVGGKAVDVMAFVNLKPLFEMVRFITPYEVEECVDLLGLDGVDALCLATNLEGGGARDSLFIDCPGEKKGLLKALSPHPVSKQNLAQVPPDALLFLGFAFDPEQIMKELDHFVNKLLPEFYPEFRSQLTQVKRETGFDLEQEVLGPLGSEVSFFVSLPRSGVMSVIPDMVLSLSLDSEEGFNQFMEKLLHMLPSEVRVVESSYEELTLRHIQPREPGIPFSPAFLVKGGRLLVASTPMTMKKYLKWLDKGEPGLAGTELFKNAMEGVPQSASLLSYVDLRRCLEMGYTTASPFIPSLLAEAELPLDAGQLPMGETLSEYISNSVSYLVCDEDGILLSSRSPLGIGAVLSILASTLDYLVENDLIQGIIEKRAVHGSRHSDREDALKTARKLMENGQYEQSAKLYSAWAKAHPGHPSMATALVNRGYCRMVLKKYPEAIADYQNLAELDESSRALAYYNITCAYSMTQETEKALAYLEKSVNAGWRDVKHMTQDSDLDPIRNHPKFKKLVAGLK
jgi:tetratricopeptide (TPR) repeat protein